MCGVAGYIGDLGAPDDAAETLGRMTEALAHRGPDARGLLVGAGFGLGHTRLSIVDHAGGRQPMSSADGRFHLSFNGEIFNHVELRAALQARGCRFRTASDTEVLLQLLTIDGIPGLHRLNGDFAFALWDARDRRMVLARDRMGVRPLFYAARPRFLAFASEIKALLQAPGIRAELDPFALDQIFTLWAPHAPRTAFKDIAELPPGHVMVADASGIRATRYWELPFSDDPDPRPEGAIAEDLRALLDDATAIRLRADVPVGAYLSGGLDSSIVCALAAPRAPQGLRTFSVTFDSPEHDESAFQGIVAGALGTRHSAVPCGAGTIAHVFPQVVAHAERPLIRTAPAPLYRLAAHVRDAGLKVVLTGEGADEVFAGYDLFKEEKIRRFCGRQPASRRRPHLLRRLYPYLPGLKQQTTESLAAFFGAGSDDPADPLYAHRPRFRATAAAKLFFSGDLRGVLGRYDAAEEVAAGLPVDFPRWHPLHQAQYIETTVLLPDYILSSQGDRMAMAHGVEGRFPFLDHRVVAFAARLPPGLKLKGLVEKHILRRATADLLPPAIAGRPKQPYRAPDSSAFFGPASPDDLPGLMGARAVAATGLFNPAAVERLVAKCRTQGAAGFRDNVAFVGVLSTQIWSRTFAAREPAHRPVRHQAVPSIS